ncbi:MAG TPA: diguanylate cyclase, partial [Arthrobacter sp.]
ATADRAERIANAISRRMADSGRPEGPRMPTVSYGIATYDAGMPGLDALIASADAALYEAKSQGRNRTARSDTAR